MYGDHHKCNVCSEQAKYIAKDTHWCRKCLDDVDYPHLKDKTLEERQAIQTAALAKIGKSSGHSFSSATGKGDDSPGGSSSGGIGFGR